jgi:cell division protein FtsZ
MGTGYAKGDRRALEAAEIAISSPLLDDICVNGATGILINFTAGPDIKLREINEAAQLIQQAAHEDAEIIFGVVTDPDMSDIVKVTVIATGFDAAEGMRAEAVARPHRSGLGLGFGHQPMAAPRAATRPSHAPTNAAPQAYRPEARDSQIGGRPSMRPSEVSAPPVPARHAASRAFGAAAMDDEAVLDIPAYLRRSAAASE